MQYFNMGVNQYLIVASHNTKVKKPSSIAIPLFGYPIPIGVKHYDLGCIKVKFRVLHGPKNNQSLCNIVLGILSLRI
jgi:hypothetical protein